jgi:actin-related protein
LIGLVVDSGNGVKNIVPVIDGYSFPHATKRMSIAEHHISSYLIEILFWQGYEHHILK